MYADDAPLRIALLAYRGKPHVGGQGVYVRHLAKALVDLGHHVEVLGGQPYPELDPRVPLVELPSLDIYNDHFPDAHAGAVGAEGLDRPRRGHLVLVRPVPRAAGVQPAGVATPPPAYRRVRPGPRQPEPRLRPARHRARRPAGDQHDPPPDHRRPPARARARRGLVQAADAAPLVLVHQHADAGGAGGWRASSRCPRTRSTTSPATTRSTPTAWPSCRSASTWTCSGRCRASRPVPGRLITTASADVTMKGLRYLLEALAKLRTERDDAHLVVIGKRKPGGRSDETIRSLGLEDHVTFVTGVPDAAHHRAVRRGRAGRRAVAVRGLLAPRHRGDGLRDATRGHLRRCPARGRRARRRDRPGGAARRQRGAGGQAAMGARP